jgi:hypothetical protein
MQSRTPARALQGQQAPAPDRTEIPAAPAILGRPGAAGVVVSTLGRFEGPPTGTLDSTNGGLGTDLWSGTSRAEADELMARLPVATTVAPVRALARRIVLTRAATPTGAADRAFTTVRLRRLLDAGMLDEAGRLAAMAEVKGDPAFARVQAEAMLFAGQQAHLCDRTTATRLRSSQPFWIELRAYCYAIGGDEDALALTRSMMDAQNINDNAFDTLLADVRQNVSKDPGDIEAPNALHIFLLRRVGLPVSFDVGVQLGTPGLLAALRSDGNSPEDRLRAAERVLRTGALSPRELTAIADAQTFTPSQFATEHAQVQQLSFLSAQALLRQAAARAAPDAQPALAYEALQHAEAKGLIGVAAVLQQNVLLTIEPQKTLHDMAGLIGRALMLTGYGSAASRWTAALDPDRALIAKFRVILNLMAPNAARAAAAQSALSELAHEAEDKMPGQAFATLALGLYAALGEAMPDDARQEAANVSETKWPGRRPAPSVLGRLDAAQDAPGRKGEALTLILNAIGPRGPGDLAPDVTVGLVRGLIREGVAGAARSIAIAALLRYRAPPPAPNAAPSP